MSRAHYLRLGTAAGLSKIETLRSTPGEVGDLWELYLKDHGVKRKSDDV